MSKTKIYVVTSGSYSYYSIEGVFTTLKLAKLAERTIYDSRIEKYYIDEISDDMTKAMNGIFIFRVDMKKNGDSKVEDGYSFVFDKPHFYFGGNSLYDMRQYCDVNDPKKESFLLDVYAKDETHAVKIANEIRTQLIADNLW